MIRQSQGKSFCILVERPNIFKKRTNGFILLWLHSFLTSPSLHHATTDSPNEVTYRCPLTALLINVNCIKILIRPFKNHILAQNMKNRCIIMYDERFWCVKTGCCQRTNQYFMLLHLENASTWLETDTGDTSCFHWLFCKMRKFSSTSMQWIGIIATDLSTQSHSPFKCKLFPLKISSLSSFCMNLNTWKTSWIHKTKLRFNLHLLGIYWTKFLMNYFRKNFYNLEKYSL